MNNGQPLTHHAYLDQVPKDDFDFLTGLAKHKSLKIRRVTAEDGEVTYDVVFPFGAPSTGKSRGELVAFLRRA